MYGKYKPHRSNGVYTAIEHLTRSLVAHNHKVTIVVPSSDFCDEQLLFADQNGFTLKSCRGLFGFFSIIKIISYFLIERPDVVHFQYVRYPSQLAVSLIAKFLGINQVISVHDGYSAGYFSHSKLKKYMYFFLFDIWLLNLVNKIHCVSDRERKQLEKWCVNKKKLHIIQNMYIRRNSKNFKYNERCYDYSYLGRVDFKHKNIGYQARLIDLVHNSNGSIKFHLCGPIRQPNQQLLIELRNEIGIKIVEHEPKFGKEKFEFLQNSKIFMHASNWELFGYSILEAVDAGCHIIISRNCDLAKELEYQPFSTILVGELANDILKLEQSRSNLSQNSFACCDQRSAFLAKFSSPEQLDGYMRLYKKINT